MKAFSRSLLLLCSFNLSSGAALAQSAAQYINPTTQDGLLCVIQERDVLSSCLQKNRSAYTQCAAKSNVLDDDDALAEFSRYDNESGAYTACMERERARVGTVLKKRYEEAFTRYESRGNRMDDEIARARSQLEEARDRRGDVFIEYMIAGQTDREQQRSIKRKLDARDGEIRKLERQLSRLERRSNDRAPRRGDYLGSDHRQKYLVAMCGRRPEKAQMTGIRAERGRVCGNPEGTCQESYDLAFIACGGQILGRARAY